MAKDWILVPDKKYTVCETNEPSRSYWT